MPVSLSAPEDLTASIEELTTGSVDGAGVFDALMRAVKAQLDGEYTNNRIRGPEYARVFSESLSVCMQVGMQYALARTKTVHEIRLLQQQLANLEQDHALKVQEATNLASQNALLVEQLATQTAQTALVEAQINKLEDELLTTVLERGRITAETELLEQKKATETAQVNGTGVTSDSVLGKQITLYGNQAASFIRDAEQKAAEILTKTWSVAAANGDGDANLSKENRLRRECLGEAIKVLLTGVGSNVATIDASIP